MANQKFHCSTKNDLKRLYERVVQYLQQAWRQIISNGMLGRKRKKPTPPLNLSTQIVLLLTFVHANTLFTDSRISP